MALCDCTFNRRTAASFQKSCALALNFATRHRPPLREGLEIPDRLLASVIRSPHCIGRSSMGDWKDDG
jgi:hypothetical protein